MPAIGRMRAAGAAPGYSGVRYEVGATTSATQPIAIGDDPSASTRASRCALSAARLAEPPAASDCDPSYPDFCIPPPPPDLDCGDVRASFTVVGSDPHRFDREGDGVGCESYG
jgi:hypothetical protein